MTRAFYRLAAVVFWALIASGWIHAGEFPFGKIYVSGNAGTCGDESGFNERIYEFDPLTGESRVFAILPDEYCGNLSGLTFTPDGSRLRASVWLSSVILEFDADGSLGVALDADDGIAGPLGSNNIAYDVNDDFYVLNPGARNILRFPSDGGPASVFGNHRDGITSIGPIALTPNGDLYYGVAGSDRRSIVRFTNPGESALFDTLPEGSQLASLAADSAGNIFALATDGLFRYDVGDPTTRRRLTNLGSASGSASIALSTDESVLFMANLNRIWGIDPDTGASTELGTIRSPEGFIIGAGIAVAIPEPGMLALVIFAGAAMRIDRLDRGVESGGTRCI